MKPALAYLLLLLVAPLAAGLPIQPVEVQHAASTLTGTTNLEGGLTALIEPPNPNRTPASLPASWSLLAERIHAERDESISPDTGPASIQRPTGTRIQDYLWAEAKGSARVPHYSLAILPVTGYSAPLLSASTSCLHVEANATGTIQADRAERGTNRQTPTVDVANALRAITCTNTAWSLTVTGSFLLILWEWTATITDQDKESHDWSSGQDPGDVPGTEKMRQTYLTITNGTLHYDNADPALGLYLDYLKASIQGTLHLYDAHAQNTQGNLTLNGTLDLSSTRIQNHAQTQIKGNVDQAHLDNQAIGLATATVHPATPAPWLLTAGLGLVAGSAVTASTARRLRLHRDLATLGGPGATRAQAAYHHACHLAQGGHHARATRFARLATRLDHLNALAWELLGDCHHEQGHYRRALRTYTRAYRILHDDHAPTTKQATTAYLVARLHARRCNHPQALTWLYRAAYHNPGILEDAQVEPDFDSLRDDLEFQRLQPDNGA